MSVTLFIPAIYINIKLSRGINGRKNGREERREETFLNGNKWKLFKGSSDSYLGHKNTISNFLNFKTLLRSSTI